jgi:hypothetical protein
MGEQTSLQIGTIKVHNGSKTSGRSAFRHCSELANELRDYIENSGDKFS